MHRLALLLSSTASLPSVEITDLDGQVVTANLSFASAARLTGVVTDTDGAPLIGVTVRLAQGGNFAVANRTDATGRYTFLLATPGTFSISAAYDGASFVAVENISVGGGQTVQQNFVAGDAALRVTLVDTQQAVAGNVVFLHKRAAGEQTLAGSGFAAADGTIEFDDLAAGEYLVTTLGMNSRGGRTIATLAAGENAAAVVTLAAHERLSGIVEDSDSDAIAGAGVELISTTDPALRFAAVSGADGRFAIESIPNGAYDLIVIVRGFAVRVVENVSLSGGDLSIALSNATSQLTGRLVDAGGNPVPHGAVEVRNAQGRKIGEAIVNTAGEFVIEGVVGANLRAAVHALGFAVRELTATVAAVGVTPLNDIALTAVAVGQGHGTQPIPQPPLPGAPDDPSGAGGRCPRGWAATCSAHCLESLSGIWLPKWL